MDLDGHSWTLVVETLPGFGMDGNTRQPLLVMTGGLLISLLLFAVAWSLNTTRSRALALARQMTATIQQREAELREITSSLGEGVYVQNQARRITFVNPEARRLLDRPQEDLLGRDAYTLFVDTDHGVALESLFGPLVEGRGFRDVEVLMLCRDGSSIPVSLTAEPIRRQSRVTGAVVSFRDLTLRKQAEEALRESQRFRLLFEYARDGLFLLESDGRVADANRLACDSLGYRHDELVGLQAARLTVDTHSITQGVGCMELFQRVRQGERVLREGELQRRDGRHFPVEVVFSPIEYENRQLIMAAVRDITERRQADEALKFAMERLERSRRQAENASRSLGQANAELRRLSQLDGLTGIANRRYLDEYLLQEWHRGNRSARPLSLVLADVDHFKAYNDRYGHQAGDDCLRQVVAAMGGVVSRTTDLLARYGGEEFAVVLPETDRPGSEYLAERVRQAVADLDIIHEASPTAGFVTLSLGVATLVPESGQGCEDLVALADAALYRAKQRGRNRVYVHDEDEEH
ncbi:MAG: diguanylate cyclase [Candidatus Competibacteraceae bacterium]|nr:diguanylate cyclase [Candidatus Competibacteraceae bacterium]